MTVNRISSASSRTRIASSISCCRLARRSDPRQAEFLAPARFGPRHLAGVGFVVEAGEMQHSVQHEDADLVFDECPNSRAWRARARAEMAMSPRQPVRRPGKESTSVA